MLRKMGRWNLFDGSDDDLEMGEMEVGDVHFWIEKQKEQTFWTERQMEKIWKRVMGESRQ